MTPAQKSNLFNALFWQYIRRLLRRQFGRILFRPSAIAHDRATLYVANHHTWWDGFFAFALNELYLHQDLHLMMGAEQFKRFRFFRRLGVFSVDQASQSDVASAFRYSIRVLREKQAPSLWIFPAGEMLPYGSAVRYRDGFARIARAAGAVQIVPVAFWTGLLDGQYPDVIMMLGTAFEAHGKSSEDIFAEGISALDRLSSELHGRVIRNDLAEFQTLMKGRASVSQRYARLTGAP